MPAKISPARRAAFLAALAETGNRTLAAERAKVSPAWARLTCAADPAFRAAADAAVATASTRMALPDAVGPAGKWRDPSGAELVMRRACGRWTQVARARPNQWTPRIEARFVAALAGSCNVAAACRQIGVTQAAAYGHRRRWAAFAARWDDAIEEGYDRLSTAMVAAACAMLGDDEVQPEPGLTVTSADQAIQLLGIYRRGKEGPARGRWRRPQSMDEVRGSILTKLEAIERARRATMTPAQAAAWQAWLEVSGEPEGDADR